MKLEFDRQDIETLLLAKARSLGIEVNKVEWAGYYSHNATVSYEAPNVTAPAMLAEEAAQT